MSTTGPTAVRSGIRSARLRHAPFALFVGGVLAYGAAFAWYVVDRFDFVNLIRDVYYDDAFYYFQIAWRLAAGEFSTFDGFTRTNGYHPLWLLLITPFYWVFDKTEALFAIKAFEIMLVAGGVALVAGAARVARLPWILLFAALPALYGNPALFLGLEAAAGLFMLGLFVLAVCLFARDAGRWRWPLAAVAFALPWVRLEYVAVSVAAAAALWFVEWSDRLPSALAGGGRRPEGTVAAPDALPFGGVPASDSSPTRGGRARSALALHAAAPSLGAAAGILAYFTYNVTVFGGAVPVSAAAKQWMSQRSWGRTGGYSLTENVHAFLQTGFFDHELLVALEVCVYAAVVWWFSRRSRVRDDRLLLAFLVGVSGLAAGHLAKFAHSVLALDASIARYDWHFVPAYLLEAVVVPARCCVAIWSVRRFVAPAPRGVSGFRLGIVVAGAVFLFAAVDFTGPFRFVDSRRESVSRRGIAVDAYMGTLVMNRLLPEDSVVGSFDSGVIGYFSRFPVVNLDGLVNSWDYLRARRERIDAAFHGRRWTLTHRVNPARRPFPGGAMLFDGPLNVEEETRFRIWFDEPSRESWNGVDRSAWFWERMEPHLDGRTDGVGLLVDGRLAWAFARDCTDALAAWTWTGGEETVLLPWTRTSTGFCASALVLPHAARPPVRAAALTAGGYLADRVGGRGPTVRSDFDVYFVEDRLVYMKEQCGQEDVDTPFFLHLDPVDPDDLPAPRRRHGFDNLDFRLDERGTAFGGACVAEVRLPEYGIAAIRTGQYVEAEGGFRHSWEGEIRVASDRVRAVTAGEHLAALVDRVRERRPAIDADFDVHLVENRLVYVKETCGPEDVDAPFFVAVDPIDPDDLPGPRRRHGFDNLDFRFGERGAGVGGACVAEVRLPEYGIAAVRTGQYVEVAGGFRHPWEGEIRVGSDR